MRKSVKEIWACDPFTVHTIWFRTLYVFFIIDHGERQIVRARATVHRTARWLAQQMLKACGWNRDVPRYLSHDRDASYGVEFNRRVRSLGIAQIRSPVRAPKANTIAERCVRTIRTECLDSTLVFGHQHLQRSINDYVAYNNKWRLAVWINGHRASPLDADHAGRPGGSLVSRFLAGCTCLSARSVMWASGRHYYALQRLLPTPGPLACKCAFPSEREGL